MATFHLHIEGQVQGVGFRPHVYRLATAHELKGWVSNGPDGVHMEVQGGKHQLEDFLRILFAEPPVRSKITNHHLTWLPEKVFHDFSIRESDIRGKTSVLLTPDIALCNNCREELHRKGKRQGYAFTTCTHCGPRYSIIQQLPYDRATTTMRSFEMCGSCQREYDNPFDRRYFSQTNSCPQCAIELRVVDREHLIQVTEPAACVTFVHERLAAGNILAVKGIGGYLLLADATNAGAIATLRERKHRPAKPFALLYPSLDILRKDVHVSGEAAMALCSPVAPIVLLPLIDKPGSGLAAEQIAPGLQCIGAMLPYAPVLELLLDGLTHPLVATSGNVSGSPIFFRDSEALAHLSLIADYFLMHNRDIVVPQDDSVWQFTPDTGTRMVLRRSRGMAPTLLPHVFPAAVPATLAMGADLKSAFALTHEKSLYASQFLGDLEDYETQKNYRHTLQHMLGVLQTRPQRILIDRHPVYFSSLMGQQLAKEWNCELKSVQHHHAHFAAVLAENELLNVNEPVLGVVWDGTGWGDDGHIWGGEFFLFQNGHFNRVHHLDYFDHWLGDKASREPRLSALGLCKHNPKADALLRDKFTGEEWKIYTQLIHEPHALQTSSVGRLFDAVASLLGVCDCSTYEGEAALKLEALARTAGVEPVLPRARWLGGRSFSLNEAINTLVDERLAGVPCAQLALNFHRDLVWWIARVAERFNVRKIACSGGVFQNALLVDLANRLLNTKFDLYWHRHLSPNDECIGFGQLVYDTLQREAEKATDRPFIKLRLATHIE